MTAKKQKEEIPERVVLRRLTSSSGQVSFSSYTTSQGVHRYLQFNKDGDQWERKGHRQYGDRKLTCVISDDELLLRPNDNVVDRLYYEMAREMAEASVFPFGRGIDAILEIVEPDQDTREALSELELEDEATDIIKKVFAEGEASIRNVGLLMGYGGDEPLNDLRLMIRSDIKQDPGKFLQLWNNPDRSMLVNIMRGIGADVIKKRSGVYQFGKNVLGATVNNVLDSFKKDEELFSLFCAQVPDADLVAGK